MTDWFGIWNLVASFPIYTVDSEIKRSTTDHLIHLETIIRAAFIRKEHLTGIFFDQEKTYDITWKYEIMRDLRDLCLNGRLPHFINGFLLERKFKICIESTHSDMKNQEEGVPQGSVLSVTLCNIKINITKCWSPVVNRSLYVDDLLICYRSKYIRIIKRKLQQCFDKINKWATENMGLDFLNLKLNVFISVMRENCTMILTWNLKRQKFQL